ncbi:mucin-19-like [Ixodes scapularis]|uniref:mucin-19-like n=1 Tax=Ixodes scapularis TaxID=6945 RepID=UPI001C393832|nr:mucin-19-like [Ixodes scapularis]
MQHLQTGAEPSSDGASTNKEAAAGTSRGTLQACLRTAPFTTTSGICYQAAGAMQQLQTGAETFHGRASSSGGAAAGTSETLQACLGTTPFTATSGICYQAAGAMQQLQTGAETFLGGASSSGEAAAGTSGTLQACFETMPFTATSGLCYQAAGAMQQLQTGAETFLGGASSSGEAAAGTSGTLQACLWTTPFTAISGMCYQAAGAMQHLQTGAEPSSDGASTSREAAAGTSRGTLQACLRTAPFTTTSGICYQAAGAMQQLQADAETFHGGASSSGEAAARTSGTLQASFGTTPFTATSGLCYQAAGAMQHLQTGAEPSSDGASTSREAAAGTSRGTLQACLRTAPFTTTSGICYQAAGAMQQLQADAETFHGGASSSGEAAAGTSGTLQASFGTTPFTATSGLCYQAAGAMQHLQTGAEPSSNGASTSREAAAGTSRGTLQACLGTTPFTATSGLCYQAAEAMQHLQTGAKASSDGASTSREAVAGTSTRTLHPVCPSLISPRLTEDVILQMKRRIKHLENENRRLVRQAALQKTREATFHTHFRKIFTADQLCDLPVAARATT